MRRVLANRFVPPNLTITWKMTVEGDLDMPCHDCPTGKFQDDAEKMECKRCDEGTYNDETGSTFCFTCIPGKYAQNKEALACDVCLAGQFQESAGGTECKSCPSGYWTSGRDQVSACTLCPSGKEGVNANGKFTYDDCQPGTYRQLAGTDVDYCKACPLNLHQDVAGSAVCVPCQPGKFSPSTSVQQCEKCPEGSETHPDLEPRQGESFDHCSLCPVGKWTNNREGVSSCSAWPSGKENAFIDDSGDSVELGPSGASPAGVVGTFTCLECIQDRFRLHDDHDDDGGQGTNLSSSCPTGWFMNSTGSSTCTKCQAGSYAEVPNTSLYENCSSGFYTGYWAVDNELDECKTCQVGMGPRTTRAMKNASNARTDGKARRATLPRAWRARPASSRPIKCARVARWRTISLNQV